MLHKYDFFKVSMPENRKADFYLGCLDGSIFMDFIFTSNKLVSLKRISFDGYGCCNLENNTIPLDYKSSKSFIEEINKLNLDQEKITKVVLKLILLNKDYIWGKALEEYNLIEK